MGTPIEEKVISRLMQYKKGSTPLKCLKKLGEEYGELIEVVMDEKASQMDVTLEIGDCAILLLKLLYHSGLSVSLLEAIALADAKNAIKWEADILDPGHRRAKWDRNQK